jgi:MFS superfamily sulfate permease-like transporter
VSTKDSTDPAARTPSGPGRRPLAARTMSWLALALMTTSSVASLRPSPTMAVFGLACVFLYLVPVSTSGSRTAVAEQAGARTQVTGLVGAAGIALLLIAAPNLLRDLPQPTLAAVVIAAALSLADLAGARRLWRQRRMEFGVCVAAFLGVALLGVLPGIAVAVGLSVLNVFRRAWWPYQTVLGRVDGRDGYHDIRVHPGARQLSGLVLFRFDAPLIFANARVFRDQVRRLARTAPPPRWIVVAAEPVTDIDTTAADTLADLETELAASGVTLAFAELKTPVRTKLARYRPTSTPVYDTLDAAVTAFRTA